MPEELSLRDALSAAYDTEEKKLETPAVETPAPATPPEAKAGGEGGEDKGPVVTPDKPVPPKDPESGKFVAKKPGEVEGKPPEGEVKPPEGEVKKPETPPASKFTAPQSWKPAVRDHWGKLPVEVQEEVTRREKEVVAALQGTVGARKFAEAFGQTIRPYEQILRMENVHPLQAIDDLFRTSMVLRQGTVAQKATMVADIVKRFNVSIEDLDKALVGQKLPDEDGRLARLLDERLKPVTSFMEEIKGVRTKRVQSVDSEITSEIEKFSEKEFFNDVKDLMADIMEAAAKRGVEMNLDQAYERAIQLDPQVQKTLEGRKKLEDESRRVAALSLPSRPSGAIPAAAADTVRGAVEAAWAKQS